MATELTTASQMTHEEKKRVHSSVERTPIALEYFVRSLQRQEDKTC